MIVYDRSLTFFVWIFRVWQNDELRAKLNSLWDELDEQGRAPYVQKALEDKERYRRATEAVDEGSEDEADEGSVPDGEFQIPKRKK